MSDSTRTCAGLIALLLLSVACAEDDPSGQSGPSGASLEGEFALDEGHARESLRARLEALGKPPYQRAPTKDEVAAMERGLDSFFVDAESLGFGLSLDSGGRFSYRGPIQIRESESELADCAGIWVAKGDYVHLTFERDGLPPLQAPLKRTLRRVDDDTLLSTESWLLDMQVRFRRK